MRYPAPQTGAAVKPAPIFDNIGSGSSAALDLCQCDRLKFWV